MKQFLAILFLVFLSLTAEAATFKISTQVQVESLTSIDPLELWSATAPISVDLAAATLNYRMVDPEAAIHRGKWRLCGLVMIGNGDVATRPIAFRIWTERPCDLSVSIVSESDSARSARVKLFSDSAEMLVIRVQELEVSVSGIALGQIRFGNTVK